MAMEEPVCDIDEEALDAALDMELAATYIKHPAPTPNIITEEETSSPSTTSQLTFAFPGWEIGISKSSKVQTPSVSRMEPQSASTKKAKHAEESVGYSAPIEGCPADAMDDDLLATVLTRLNVRELCACMRTCKRWHRVACREDVWAHVPVPGTPAPASALPRWMEIRNGGLSMDLRMRFQVFRRGYEFVRSALNAWWDHEKPDSNHPSAIFRSLTQKLVINDWSLLYEAFGAAFSDRADRVAVVVLVTIQRVELKRRENGLHLPNDVWDEDEVQQVWVLVLEMWRRFKRWLMLVVSHCPELNHEVMAERARSNALATTPTVYGKGIICFRSQVILKYGIRSVLQATWSGLASAKRGGIASDNELDLFRSADHLFQETSTVLDDLTLSPTTFTQQKLRRCFGSETSTKTKPRGKPTPAALS